MTLGKALSHVPIIGVYTPDGWKRAKAKRAERELTGRRSFVGAVVTLPFRAALWLVAWPVALVRSRNRRSRIETNRILAALDKRDETV